MLPIAVSALVWCPIPAYCEVSVRGTVAAVRLEAERAPLPEVLGALGASLGLRYDAFIAIDDAVVAGTYSGTLQEVLGRVLAGFNYLIKTQAGSVEVIIVGRPGDPPPPIAAEPSPATNTNPAAQWRRPASQTR